MSCLDSKSTHFRIKKNFNFTNHYATSFSISSTLHQGLGGKTKPPPYPEAPPSPVHGWREEVREGKKVPVHAQGVGVERLRVQARADVNEQLFVQSCGYQVYSWLPPFLSDGSENVRVEIPLRCYWPVQLAY